MRKGYKVPSSSRSSISGIRHPRGATRREGKEGAAGRSTGVPAFRRPNLAAPVRILQQSLPGLRLGLEGASPEPPWSLLA